MIFDRHQLAHRLFHTILHDGDTYAIKILLLKSRRIDDHDVDLNCLEYDGQSLVHLCCLYNRLDLLKVFVECGQCDLSATNRDGWLPLHLAVYLGHMAIVVYLLQFMKSNRPSRQ